jgi:hypothetical protein
MGCSLVATSSGIDAGPMLSPEPEAAALDVFAESVDASGADRTLTARAVERCEDWVLELLAAPIASPVLTTINSPESPLCGSITGGWGWMGVPVLARNSQDPPVIATVRKARTVTKRRRIDR